MRRWLTAALVLLLTLCARGEGLAESSPYVGTGGDFESVYSATAQPVVHGEVTHTLDEDTPGVLGWSEPQPYYGIGVKGRGGYVGVFGEALIPGIGSRRGLWGRAANGSSMNYGLISTASGPSGSINYGVYGAVSGGSGSINYGVYGVAPTGSAGAAVFVAGDLKYTESLVGPISDLRLKENIAAAGSSLPRIMNLEVVSYEHRRDPEFSHINLPESPRVGFVAQQVAEVFPDLVTEMVHPREIDPDRKELAEVEQSEPIRFLALKQMQMIPHLVRAIQEQQVQIEALQAQLAPLRQRLAALEGSDEDPVVLASAK